MTRSTALLLGLLVVGCQSPKTAEGETAEGSVADAAGEGAAVTDAAAEADGATSDDTGSEDATAADATSDASATSDAASKDAPHADGSVAALSIGAAAVRQRVYSTSPPTGTLTTSPVTTKTGSILLASLARGTWSAAPDAPTDSRGNGFALLGATHAYADWPTSKTGLFDVLSAKGGAGHTFSMTWGDIGGTGDEVTISVVEVVGATSIEDSSWVERPSASTITSGKVTTSGPAILVAWWWGTGKVLPAGEKHVAVPGSGFSLVPPSTALTSLSENGYVQVAVASRVVEAAGTYSVTWTTSEGAQLYLVALR